MVVSEGANLLLTFGKLAIVIFFLSHWLACILYMVGNMECSNYGYCWIIET